MRKKAGEAVFAIMPLKTKPDIKTPKNIISMAA